MKCEKELLCISLSNTLKYHRLKCCMCVCNKVCGRADTGSTNPPFFLIFFLEVTFLDGPQLLGAETAAATAAARVTKRKKGEGGKEQLMFGCVEQASSSLPRCCVFGCRERPAGRHHGLRGPG